MKRKTKQPLIYLILAWMGRRIYDLRSGLEYLQYWIDKKAGEYWNETW